MPSKSGFVYVVGLGDGKLFKIGKTINFDKRLKELSAANVRIYVAKCRWVYDYSNCEKRIHARYIEQRVKREVYRLSEQDINNIGWFLIQQTEESLAKRKDRRYLLSQDRIKKFGSAKS